MLVSITTLWSTVNLHPVFLKIGHPVFLKIGHPAFWKKQGTKNQGHCYSKREEAARSLLFLNKKWPCFFQPAFCKMQGARFLRKVGADWLGDCLNGLFSKIGAYFCRLINTQVKSGPIKKTHTYLFSKHLYSVQILWKMCSKAVVMLMEV